MTFSIGAVADPPPLLKPKNESEPFERPELREPLKEEVQESLQEQVQPGHEHLREETAPPLR